MSRIRSSFAAAAVAAVLVLLATHAFGDVFVGPLTGTSADGNPIAVSAQLAVSGTLLTITLNNVSSVNTSKTSDVLSSMYFDIKSMSGTNVFRPTLSYLSGTGTVYQVLKSGPDTLIGGYDLKAVNDGADTWQYRSMNATVAPFLGFGIGTVGNNIYAPSNGFTPAIVGQIGFGIYRGNGMNPNIAPADGNLDGRLLVVNSGTFRFGLSGTTAGGGSFTETDISPEFVFGFGTNPDSVIVVPEPGSLVLVGGCLATLSLAIRRRQWLTGQAKSRMRLPSGSRATSSRKPSACTSGAPD